MQITPLEDKVEELLGRNPPTSKKDLQSVLGSLNQLSQWCPTVKVKIPLMRKMCGNNNIFKASPQLEEEFNTMKSYIKKTVTLSLWRWGKNYIFIPTPQIMALDIYFLNHTGILKMTTKTIIAGRGTSSP